MAEHNINLDEFKALLLARRQSLLDIDATGEAASQVVELDQTRVGRLSRMDALQAQAMSLETQRRHKQELVLLQGNKLGCST